MAENENESIYLDIYAFLPAYYFKIHHYFNKRTLKTDTTEANMLYFSQILCCCDHQLFP